MDSDILINRVVAYLKVDFLNELVWGMCSSVVEGLTRVYKVLDSVQSTAEQANLLF